MIQVTEGTLTFTFPNGWRAPKVDDWSYYRNQFERYFDVRYACKKCNAEIRCRECETAKTTGVKAVDILAIAPGAVVWLIEVKDYRTNQRTKAIELADEVAAKVRDSLAMFMAASKQANDENEKNAATAVARATTIHVVLHVEQVQTPSRLFPRAINPANVQQRLRRLLRFLDPHPLVVETNHLGGVAWAVA